MANEVGRPVAVDTPEEFERVAFEYIEWAKSNPVMKTITATFQGEISYLKVPHMRGMTQFGLAAHMGIGLSTLKDYGKKEEFSAIYKRVHTIMKAWNLDGSMSGDLNPSLVARIDGHADTQKTDITTNGESINKSAIDVSKLTDEQLRVLNSIVPKGSETGTIETKSE